jgi:hypothetical protein
VNWDLKQTHDQVTLDALLKYQDPWLPKNYSQIEGLPKYQQVFSDENDFITNASILDMLFCVGGREINKLWAPPVR